MSIQEQAFHTVLRIHERVYIASDGRIGHKILGVPTLLLRTTGRRSGQTRTGALVYAKDGDRYLVVPSAGGADAAPAWLHNLRAQPNVEMQLGRRRQPATATEITHDDPDFQRVWRIVDDANGHRYDAYQAKTKRPIPVVALTPAG